MEKSKYGTEIMNDEECLLFVEIAIQNGSPVGEAIQDMRTIDNLMVVKRNHILAFSSINRTAAGYARKGTKLWDALENVIDARVKAIEM